MRSIISRLCSRRCNLLHHATKYRNTSYDSRKFELSSSDMTDYKSMVIRDNFITAAEENILLTDIETKLKRMKYESSHWDDVIHGYREIQKLNWSEQAQPIIERLRTLVPPPILPYTHVLDLSAEGFIKPHTDSVDYCGPTLAVLSLLSDAVIKLEHNERAGDWFKMLVRRYSVYQLEGELRYEYKHSILVGEDAVINGERVEKGRRLSVIVRGDVKQVS